MATNELSTNLRITGDNAVKRGLKDVGDAADKAGDQIEDLSDETDHLAESAANAQAEYKKLIQTFQETGDLDKKALGRAKREVRFFENLKKELEADLKQAAIEVAGPGGGNAGGIIGEGLAKGIGAAIASGGPYVIGGLAAMAAATLPFLGGVVASAVLGGVGTGGIIGGFALATQDPRVKDAAEQLGETALREFTFAAEPFVAPAIEALRTLESASISVAGEIGGGFRSIAPTLKPLTDGIVGLVKEALPGLLKGFEAAKPVIRVIANELPEIGQAVGDFVGIIAEDTDGAVMAFAALSDIIQVTLRATGALILHLSKAYEWSVNAAEKVSGVMEGVLGWVPLVGDALSGGNDWTNDLLDSLEKSSDASQDFAGDLDDVGDSATQAAADLAEMTQAVDDLFDVTMGLDKATLAYKQGVVDLRKELMEGARTLDLNTQAGRDNMDATTNLIQRIEGIRDAEAASTLGIEEANKRYVERLELLRKDMIQMGYNTKAVDELIKRYLAVPNAINVQLNLKAGGDAAAWSAFRNLERHQPSSGSTGGMFLSGLEARAGGGPTRAGRSYIVGENGPELWSESTNGYVHNAAQTSAMMSGSSGGSAMPQMVLSLAPSSGDELEQAI